MYPIRLRSIVVRVAVCFVGVLSFGTMAYAAPVHLRCNYRDTPLGIDTHAPTFSWQSDSTAKNWKQTAYRITVSSAEKSSKSALWDSGKQQGVRSVDIPYTGPALQSHTRYSWIVEVWDNQGHSHKAPATWFETGLAPTDWKAQWIGAPDPTETLSGKLPWIWASGQHALTPAVHAKATLQRTFTLPVLPVRASLSVAANSEFTAYVNGKQTGHKVGWLSFDYEDIHDVLRAGDNTIRIEAVAPGEKPAWDQDHTRDAAGVSVLLRWTDAQGQEHRLTSADGWQAKAGDSQAFAPAEIIAPLNDPREGNKAGIPPQPAALLRTEFVVEKPVRSARLYATAAGSYEFHINGKTVTTDVLLPGFTDFRKRLLYQTYDVTALLHTGPNAAGALLGEGWYSSPMLWNGSHAFFGQPRMLAQLHIEYQDGTSQVIATSPTWQTSPSSIQVSQIYAGEHQDAQLEQRGWDNPGLNVIGWSSAVTATAPLGRVTAQPDAPIHPQTTLRPISRKVLPNGDAVFDMGQNMVGWATLRVQGQGGSTVRLRFAERLQPDGSIYTENLRNAEATDVFTLRGGGEETFTPHFTFHGFRYVQISGLPTNTPDDALAGVVLNSLDAQPSGRLETSSDLLNRMWTIGLWGQRGNFVSIPTDCPQRDERQGWTGDAGAFWRTGSYNFDIAAFSRKFMNDLTDAQQADGAFTDIAPDLLAPHPGAPGWGDAGVIVPYTAWLQYGDRTSVAEHWDAMERWMGFIQTNNPDMLRKKALGANYADWLAPDPHTPPDLVATAYWAILARMMQQMALAVGKDDAPYASLYEGIRHAYQAAYLSPEGAVQGDTQTGDLVTLYAGLAPPKLQQTITQRLVQNIRAHNTHLTTGFLGTPFLLTALAENGQTSTAYDLLLQTTYPSWGYMLAGGATTWWERWNGDTGDPSMNSYNHYAFGSVVAWIYRSVVGIDVASPGKGFQHLRIAPHYTDRLQFARGSYDSVYGTVESGWTRGTNGHYHLRVKVPANAEADVYPNGPDAAATHVGSGVWEFDSGKL